MPAMAIPVWPSIVLEEIQNRPRGGNCEEDGLASGMFENLGFVPCRELVITQLWAFRVLDCSLYVHAIIKGNSEFFFKG